MHIDTPEARIVTLEARIKEQDQTIEDLRKSISAMHGTRANQIEDVTNIIKDALSSYVSEDTLVSIAEALDIVLTKTLHVTTTTTHSGTVEVPFYMDTEDLESCIEPGDMEMSHPVIYSEFYHVETTVEVEEVSM